MKSQLRLDIIKTKDID